VIKIENIRVGIVRFSSSEHFARHSP